MRPWTVLALLLAILLFAAHGPVLVGGRTWSDPHHVTEVMPARLAAVEAIADGRLPGWWDRAGLGAPLWAEPAHGAAYPGWWPAALAPDHAPWLLDVLAVLHALWAALGVALLARRLGADDLGALVAGALVAVSDVTTAAMIGGTVGAVAHLPWAAWAGDGIARAATRRGRVAAAASLTAVIAAILFAGRLAIAVDAAILAGAVAMARAPRRGAAAAWCGGAIAAAIGLAAMVVVPAASHLAGEVASGAGARVPASPWTLLEVVVPGARRLGDGGTGAGSYLGGAAVLLAIAALARGGEGRRVLGGVALALLALAAGLLPPWDALVGIDRAAADPAEHVAAAAVLIAALAGLGFTQLAAERPDRRTLGAVAGGGAALVVVIAVLGAARPLLARALADDAGGLDLAVTRVDDVLVHGVAAVAVALIALGLLIAASRRPLAGEAGTVHLTGRTRTQSAQESHLTGRTRTQSAQKSHMTGRTRTQSAQAWAVPLAGVIALGHAALVGRLLHRHEVRASLDEPPSLLAAAARSDHADELAALTAAGLAPRLYRPTRMGDEPVGSAAHQTLDGAVATRFGVAAARWSAPGRQRVEDRLWAAASTAGGRLFDRFAIELAIVPSTITTPADLPVLGERAGWALAVTRARRSRALLAPRWRWFDDDAAAVRAMFPPDGEPPLPLGTVARVGAGDEPPADADTAARPCDVRADTPERVVVHCDPGPAGVITLLDAWAPGWTVTVDGEPAVLERVDVVARGVVVGPGEHVAVFVYAPPGGTTGRWISALSALALVVALGAFRIRSRV